MKYDDLVAKLRRNAQGRHNHYEQAVRIVDRVIDPNPPVEEYIEWRAADAIEQLQRSHTALLKAAKHMRIDLQDSGLPSEHDAAIHAAEALERDGGEA